MEKKKESSKPRKKETTEISKEPAVVWCANTDCAQQ